MANGHGGNRTPRNPAPVSGPGAMSQRTDGGPAQPARYLSGGDYGDGQDMMDLQRSAPMAASPAPQTQAQRAGTQPGDAPSPTPLDAPTERPDEPVTEGSAVGPGAGPEVLSNAPAEMAAAVDADRQVIAQHLPRLMMMASQSDSPTGFRMFVRHMRNLAGGDNGVSG